MNTHVITLLHFVFLALQIIVLQLIVNDYLAAKKSGQWVPWMQKKGSEIYVDLIILVTFILHLFLWPQDFDTSKKHIYLFSAVAYLGIYVFFGMSAFRALSFKKNNKELLLSIDQTVKIKS